MSGVRIKPSAKALGFRPCKTAAAPEGRNTSHTYSNLLIHAVFGTKNGLPVLDSELKSELFPYMAGIVKNVGGLPIAVNGPSDHVHVLFVLPAPISVSKMMEKLKANSSKWIHQRWPERRFFAWQEGYGAFSVSYSNLNRVRDYISRQEEHHARRSFREELVTFLEKNEVSYDPRFVGP